MTFIYFSFKIFTLNICKILKEFRTLGCRVEMLGWDPWSPVSAMVSGALICQMVQRTAAGSVI